MSITYRFISRFSFVFFIFLFVVALTQFHVPSVAAQEGEGEALPAPSADECNGLDIVLMIDQSTSMGGALGIAASDPENFRIASVNAVINQLGDNRLYFCPHVIHRLGVISFGDNPDEGISAQIDLPFTEISPDPNANLEFWQSDRENLKAQIQAKDLGATDFRPAFATAKQMFDGLEALEGAARKRSIILLTDGSPCVVSLGCGSDFATGPYLDQLRSQIQQDFPPGDGNELSFWPVAMRDPNGTDYLGNFIGGQINQTLEQYWATMAQSYGSDLIRLSQNEQEIPATFFEIISELGGTGNVESLDCGTHYIEPYTERVIFTFFKNSQSLGVEMGLRLSDGTVVTLQNGQANPADKIEISEHSLDDQIERYVIYKPSPGAWTITSDNCQSVKIYREAIIPAITLVNPTAPLLLYDIAPFYDPEQPHYLTYEIRERGTGRPFAQDEQYPLQIQVDLTSPSGEISTQTLFYSADATYRSSEPLPVGELGVYNVMLVGQTLSANPSSSASLPLFEEERASYRVRTEVINFDFEILSPSPNSVIPLNEVGSQQVLPISLKMRLIDEEGRPLNPTRVFTSGPESWFQITLTDQDGNSSIGSVMSEAAEPSILSATLDELTIEGAYTLEVLKTGTHDPERFLALREQASIALTRVRTEYFNFEILEPQSGSTQALNEVGGGQSRLTPIPVRVRLVDLSSTLLDPTTVFENASAPLLNAILYAPDGTALETIELQADTAAGAGHFRADFAAQDLEGEYRIEVGLLDIATKMRYQAEAEVQELRFTRVRTEPFDFQILLPSTNTALPIHESGAGCVAGTQVYPSVAVELMSGSGGALSLVQQEAILASPAVAMLVAPDGTVEEIELEMIETPSGAQLVGNSQSIPALDGDYKFEVSFGPDQVRPEFAALQPTRQVVFNRSDSLFTTPLACRGVSGLIGLIIMGLLLVAGWLMVGGPRGTLTLIDPYDNNVPVAGPWVLRFYPRFQSKSGPQLEALGIKKIKISSAEPLNPDARRAIKVEAIDMDGTVFVMDMVLDAGDYPQPFTDGAEIYYE